MQTYLVGGAVRDRLLNLPVSERDWVVVGASVDDMLALGYKQVGNDFPVFIHPKTGEEYALARTERKSAKGHSGFIVHSSPDISLQEDLLRRDLTINAIAQDENGALIDPYNGREDLHNCLLRHVSPAFAEDPLRVFRVARFAAKLKHLHFKIDSETLKLMQTISQSGELKTLSVERIWQETRYALESDNPETYFFTLLQCGALHALLPELAREFNDKVKQQQLNRLNKITGVENRYVVIVAIACRNSGHFSVRIADSTNKIFGVPQSVQELTSLAIKNISLLGDIREISAEQINLFLRQLDAYRRIDRCKSVLNAMQSIDTVLTLGISVAFDFLCWLLPQLASIRLSEEEYQKLSGKEIAAALEELRCQTIGELRTRYFKQT